uniref:FACT complex subunit n=1 Tax=Strongyloides papillosus TaxID=174720 RepID=A0A0N5B1R1_STREA
MFQGYRRTYRNIRLLRKAAERERIERSDEPAEEILENIDIDAEESIIVDDTNLGILEDEKWEFISTENDDNNEDTDDSVPLYENASITLKAFVDELMNAKIKSGTSDRGHEMYLSVIKKALPQPNRLFTSLEGTRNYLSRGKYTLSNEAIYEDLEGGKLVIYNAKRRINDIFKMYKKEIISYTEEMLSSPYLKDSICGELYKTIRNVDKDIFTIGVQMHFDDAHFNITNRTHKIYPISLRILNLPISIRNKFQFYIPLAIYYGEKIPVHSMEKKIERTFECKLISF